MSWINDFLTGKTQRVLVDGCCSDDTSVTLGVPQGTVLAPLLFLIFINDLPENIASSIKLHADDVLINFIELSSLSMITQFFNKI